MNKKKVMSLHDRLFKESISNKKVAKDFFKAHLPKDIQRKIDWSSLQLQPDSFIDEELEASFTDILYKLTFSSEQGYIYILSEHQSAPDEWMPLRLWQYLCKIWHRHTKQTKSKKLPLIYPIVFYHGRRSPYPFSMDFFSFFEEADLAKKLFLEPFRLIDVTMIPDKELQEHGYVALMELLQKHIFQRDMLPLLQELKELKIFNRIQRLGERDYMLQLVTYILEKGKFSSVNRAIDLLVNALPDWEEEIMAGSENLVRKSMEEGKQQGMQQGMQQGAQSAKAEYLNKLRSNGFSDEEVCQMLEISKLELRRILNQNF